MKIYCFIFARGGSKGLPKKNVKILNGKPLIEWSIDVAKNIERIKKIIVSTDCSEIAKISRARGVSVINRPKSLATDNSPEFLSWKHAIKVLEDQGEIFDTFLSLPSTAPLRSKNDVIKCLDALVGEFDSTISMSKAHRNPWFNMVRKNDDNTVEIVNNEKIITRRQDAPTVYDLNTVAYVSKVDFIKKSNNLFEGKTRGVEIPIENALDIDTDFDFRLAELLLEDKFNVRK